MIILFRSKTNQIQLLPSEAFNLTFLTLWQRIFTLQITNKQINKLTNITKHRCSNYCTYGTAKKENNDRLNLNVHCVRLKGVFTLNPITTVRFQKLLLYRNNWTSWWRTWETRSLISFVVWFPMKWNNLELWTLVST